MERRWKTPDVNPRKPRQPGPDPLVYFLKRSHHIPQTRPVLKTAVADMIRDNHREDAEYLRSRYGVNLDIPPQVSGTSLERESWSVEDILESVDPDIVVQVWKEFRRFSARRRISAARNVAARAYRAAPTVLKPDRLDALLRTRFSRTSAPS